MESAGEPPIDPGECPWALPDPFSADHMGLAGVGADLEPSTLIAAYRRGLFPMPVGGNESLAMGWWSPDPRCILPLDGLRVTRSLRKARRDFEIRIDTAFDAVLAACADPRRDGAWINRAVADAYGRLHRMGWAHSVEAWSTDTGELAGGLYGVAIGGLFAGESMFHRRTDASKVALVGLVDLLREDGADRLVDVQWRTDHLATLGVVEISRADYLERLRRALVVPLPARWTTLP